MTLNEIEYGSLASSTLLNNNFQYLQDKITELSNLITSETSSFSSSVATLNNSVSELLNYMESFIPTGCIMISQSPTTPDGFLLCDGSEVLISEYENLYKIIGKTYGQNDSTTFCLPNLINRTVFGTSSNHSLGECIEAGLPEISATLTPSGAYWGGGSGAFYPTGGSSCNQNYGGSSSGIGFEASRSNAIYGNSDTVQPPAIATNFIIKY